MSILRHGARPLYGTGTAHAQAAVHADKSLALSGVIKKLESRAVDRFVHRRVPYVGTSFLWEPCALYIGSGNDQGQIPGFRDSSYFSVWREGVSEEGKRLWDVFVDPQLPV
jgi:hypothetical protein